MNNESSPDDVGRPARKRLTEACRAKNNSVRLAWAITVCEAILLGGFAFVLADYWLMLPVNFRTAGAALLLVLALIGVYRLARLYRRPTRLKEAALDLETQRPELGCEISTAAEYLSGERKITHKYEPELVAALETKAANELSGPAVHYEFKLVRPAVLLGLTLLALLIFAGVAPVAFTALKRFVLPFSKTHYTSVEVQPGSVEIPVGRDLTITNIFTGRSPRNPQLHWQDARNPVWQTIGLTKSSNETYLYEFKELRADLKYRVTGNDAVSSDFEIKTYVPPEVKALSIRIDRPAYTQLKPIFQESPEISALRASIAQFRIQPTVKLADATLRFSAFPEAVALKENPDGSWGGNVRVTRDTDYWIDLQDAQGHHGVNPTPYHIKAIPDQPPRVEIVEPGQDTRAAATNKVPVKLSVTDDFGVGEIKLVFHRLGGPEQMATVKRDTSTNGEITAHAELDLSTLDLRDYELVAYHAEARDNNTLDGPGVGKSPVYFVEITDEQGQTAKSQGQGQRVNLLVIQKQIIADTAALDSPAASNKFTQLAARQRDAADFGRMYLEALGGSNQPAGAAGEMGSAIKAMEKAGGYLAEQKRAAALPAEEQALAHLYQVLKQIPELAGPPPAQQQQQQSAAQKTPATNKLQVVLEAIKKKNKEEPDNKEIAESLQNAQNLAQAQEALNAAGRHPGDASGRGQSPGAPSSQPQNQSQSAQANAAQNQKPNQSNNPNSGKNQSQNQQSQSKAAPGQGQSQSAQANAALGQGQGQGQGQSKSEQANAAQGKGKGQDQGQGKGQGQGQGQGQAAGQNDDQGQSADPPSEDQAGAADLAQLAEKESQLSQEAAALAEKLERLASHDQRLGHNVGQNASQAAQHMAAAAQAMKQGRSGQAGIYGYQGELGLKQVAAELERILRERPRLADVASEDAPKEYDALISEYFKKLSHAE